MSTSTQAQARIKDGLAKGVNSAYKCRVRDPWWRTPFVPVPDLFLKYMNHDTPRLCTNDAGVYFLNSVHGVRLKPEHKRTGMDLLPLASLNSMTLLGAEIVGRAYGGGMLKIEPREADRLPLPCPAAIETHRSALEAIRPFVEAAHANGELLSAVHAVDDVLLRDLLSLHESEIQTVRAARERLFKRRASRGRKNRIRT
jgi:adenine-specific DNA-methyltransferase